MKSIGKLVFILCSTVILSLVSTEMNKPNLPETPINIKEEYPTKTICYGKNNYVLIDPKGVMTYVRYNQN